MWLFEKIKHKQKYLAESQQKEFVNGESLLYLGRYYPLSIVDEGIEGVKFKNRFHISKTNQSHATELLKRWYVERAKEQIIPKVESFARNLGVKYNSVLVSDLKYRWGSCTLKDNLNFNWRIIKAPISAIDYIIVHELTHLIEANHTPKFWNLVAVLVPKYKRAKEWLKQNGKSLEVDF